MKPPNPECLKSGHAVDYTPGATRCGRCGAGPATLVADSRARPNNWLDRANTTGLPPRTCVEHPEAELSHVTDDVPAVWVHADGTSHIISVAGLTPEQTAAVWDRINAGLPPQRGDTREDCPHCGPTHQVQKGKGHRG